MSDPALALAPLVDPRRTAVLVVDVQEVFVNFPALYPPVAEVLPRLQRFIYAARAAGALVVRIQTVIPQELYSENWRRQFPRHGSATWFAPGSDNVRFHPGFEPQAGDILLTKPRFSAFVGTALDTLLRSRGIRTVIVAGLTTDVCVGSTARDAFQREYVTITLADCTAEASQASHDSGLQTLGRVFGTVCESTDVMAIWQGQSGHHGEGG